MIRNAKLTDLTALQHIAEGTQMFLGEELESFLSEMAEHLRSAETEEGAGPSLLVVTDEETEEVVGAAYFAPEVMAQGVMNLLFIGVLSKVRKKGFGQMLLQRFEEAAVREKARLAIIETASDSMFASAWSLYERAGYEREARVRDFYDDGLDKLVFRKRP